MTTENLNYDSLMDLSLHDFDVMYCKNVGENEVEDVCATCKYNVGICDCVIHADNLAYVENGRGIIVHCNMYEKQLPLAEVQKKWLETLRHTDNSDDCAMCEYRKKCFFASYGYDEGQFPCVWETIK